MQAGEKSASAVSIHAQMWKGMRQAPRRARNEQALTLTLTPKSADSGLDIFVVTKFPFLVSNASFSRYKREHSSELNNLSPLHACISQKAGQLYIEDLGSSHGTFVDGVRLRELPTPLQDGVVIAFGGKHFVYEVSVARQTATEPADGAAGTTAPAEPESPQAYDKTMFMAAPSTFLQVFCDPEEAKLETAAAPAKAVVAAAPLKEVVAPRKRPGRARQLLTELSTLATDGDPEKVQRNKWIALAVAGVICTLGVTGYFWNATERDLNGAMATGDYAQAATLATRLLEKNPDDSELKAKATESALKANVPQWLAKARAHDFDGARSVLAKMSDVARRDPDLTPMLTELQWLGDLERLVNDRGGPSAPIRIYADEDTIEHFIGRWNDDTGEHQRALDRIASHVPQFGDWYGESLTHLRKLQSESSVYLPVIERLKSNIALELQRDDAEALVPVLKEAAEKYPSLGGLKNVRQDLDRYIDIRQEAHSHKTGRLFALLHNANFVTPPFKQSIRELTEGGQLPPADLLEQYDAATQAWKSGKPDEAFAALQKMTIGTWGEDVAKELERRQAVAAQYAVIHQSRSASDFVDQLLAFRTSLDADEDVFFVRATATDLSQQKETLVARARDAMNRASRLWQEYKTSGAIDASQRIETSISEQFRTRAHLLAEASRYAQQGYQIYSQVDATRAAQWVAMRDEIDSEADQQRSRLQDLSRVVEPELLRTKLALLGASNGESNHGTP
jgi:pSer/pThr/pTyr-binding forkhead associated (FHA) protein